MYEEIICCHCPNSFCHQAALVLRAEITQMKEEYTGMAYHPSYIDLQSQNLLN